MNIVLVAPEIPQNTGNIGRLCVSAGCKLHLIKPLGFSLDDKYLKRAGMDYWKHVDYCLYENWDDFLALLHRVSAAELYFLLDLLSVAAAFDGQVSRLEKHHLPEAFKELTDVYMLRTSRLTKLLAAGQLHAAKALCSLDFQPG